MTAIADTAGVHVKKSVQASALISLSGKHAVIGAIHPQARPSRDTPYRLVTEAEELRCFAKRVPDELAEESLQAICIGDYSLLTPNDFHADIVIKGRSEKLATDLLDIFEFLAGLLESQSKAFDVLEEFGADAKQIVTDNPYRIVEIDGIGFKTADKAARQLWGEPFDRYRPERLAAALALAVQEQCLQTGSTVVSKPAAINTAMGVQFLDLPQLAETRAKLEAVLPDLVANERLAFHQLRSAPAVGLTRYLHAERSVAKIVNEKLGLAGETQAFPLFESRDAAAAHVTKVTEDLPFQLAPSQLGALEVLLTSTVAVLTGGPGTGKTTITRVFCDAHEAVGSNMVLVAPTGRAAQRLSESTGRAASTIHRAFMIGPGGRATVNSANPLPVDVLIVDEASMLDAGLARVIMNGVQPSCHVVFVGDVDQLPAIMPGNVLTDLLATRHVPRAQLTETMRQAAGSHIIQAAKQFNTGKGLPKRLSGENDFLYVEAQSDHQALEYARRLLLEVFPQVEKKNGGMIDLARDVQILCTHNDKGEIARWNVSQFFAQIVNPSANRARLRAGQNSKTSGFANPDEMIGLGDKVIALKNDYDLGVMNGEIGFVVDMKVDRGGYAFEIDGLTVEFDPLPCLDCDAGPEGDPRRVVTFKGKTLKNVTAAGAITVHKAQGSQFPAVICLVPRSAGGFVSRRLVYTAMTRAQEFLAVIGVRDACELASREMGSPRMTTLAENLAAAGSPTSNVENAA